MAASVLLSDAERIRAGHSFFAELCGEAEAVPAAEMELFEDVTAGMSEQAKQYTAVLFAKHQPEKCRRVIFLLALGWGENRIARTVGCGDHTVLTVRRTMAEKVALAEGRLAEILDDVILQQLVRLRENPEALDIDKAPLAVGVLLDKRAALRGIAPPPQLHLHRVLSAEDIAALIADAEGMGLGVAGNLANGAGAGGAVGCVTVEAECVSLEQQAGENSIATQDATSPLHRGGEGVAPISTGAGSADALPSSQNPDKRHD